MKKEKEKNKDHVLWEDFVLKNNIKKKVLIVMGWS